MCAVNIFNTQHRAILHRSSAYSYYSLKEMSCKFWDIRYIQGIIQDNVIKISFIQFEDVALIHLTITK